MANEKQRGEERGATSIEYALIAALIFLAIVPGVGLVGDGAINLYQQVVDAFP